MTLQIVAGLLCTLSVTPLFANFDLQKKTQIKSLAMGSRHSCALLDGQSDLRCWGGNSDGQLGLGDTLDRLRPTPVSLPPGKIPIHVSAGGDSTCITYKDGLCQCWGSNRLGVLGLGIEVARLGSRPSETPDKLPFLNLGSGMRVKKLVNGTSHVCALLEDGRIKCWGSNYEGKLGLGHLKDIGLSPAHMGDNLPFIDLGRNLKGLSLAIGHMHSCALLNDGTIKCWGYGPATGNGGGINPGSLPGQMGDNLAPINLGRGLKVKYLVAGQNHNCATLSNERVKCWGANWAGSLGIGIPDEKYIGTYPEEMGDNLPYVNLGENIQIKEISCGVCYCCARLENNAFKCWGNNYYGNLGIGGRQPRGKLIGEMGDNLPFVNLGRLAMVQEIKVGDFHQCAVMSDGSLKCWGRNGWGGLGNGTLEDIGEELSEMGENLLPVKFSND